MTFEFSGAIDHVHVYAPSRKEAASWYKNILGFEIVEKYAFWATDEGGPLTISHSNGAITFALFRSDQPKPVSLAFGANKNEYSLWKSDLRNKEIEFHERDHTLCHSIYFSDPFGNQLEITTYEV